jgi:AcrR family transcriptional regulator
VPATSRVTPRRTPRQARSVETLERILDAAAQVFSRHGYASGTTNRIAAEASMSIGSLYQYFPNKDAIVLALARRHMAETTDQLRACFAAHHHDLPGLIEAVVDVMVDAHAADAALHQVLFEQAPRPPELTSELDALEEELVGAVAGLLRHTARPTGTALAAEGSPDDRATDPDRFDDVARVTVATVESLVHRLVATETARLEPHRLRDELVWMVTGYLERAVGDAARSNPPAP